MRSTLPQQLRLATLDDWPEIWPTWTAVAQAQESYTYDPATSYDDARAIWFAKEAWVSCGPELLGTYQLGPNQPGPGAHVANASYMTFPAARGRGVGRAMGAHSLDRARERGFTAMQFNAVVSTNEVAVRLWESLGFATVGRVPGAYLRGDGAYADLLVMHRDL
jgi:GNAT superfamily N-acetyltransferase